MPSLYYLNVTIHVLAAMLWLGGMFFLALVGAPVLRQVEPPALRAKLFSELGLRFRTAGWGTIAVLVVTGVFNLHYRGLLSAAVWSWGSPFWHTPMGHALAWKLLSVAAMIAVSGVHDLIQGPAAGRMQPGSPESQKARRRAMLLARLNAILGVVIVIAAVHLARGG
ncbi:MAG TPA: DUF4149 domain-containing protein [Longimicrobiaceae bacterium]|nr:DUF4149 domain-containing protein [Longimicrobiaceae bacterium]